MYQDAVIPFSKIYAEKFTEYFELSGSKIIVDFSEVECMKQAKKEESEALRARNMANQIAFQNGIITVNEWRQSIEMDAIENGDRYKSEKDNEDGNEGKTNESSGQEANRENPRAAETDSGQ
jgi:hypothetical protein